jgi:5-methylcytosine-specific restriction endonuclease McrA
MQTWIFQINPDEYDIDAFLASRPIRVSWHVTRYASEIAIGDRVYLWRNDGSSRANSGIIAEAVVTAPVAMRLEDPAGAQFCRSADEGRSGELPRALLRLVKVANGGEMVKRAWFENDPILFDLPALLKNATSFRIAPRHASRTAALWSRAGRDLDRNESLAVLWVYSETYGGPVSRKANTPLSHVALLVGRTIDSVYSKLAIFRALDPRSAFNKRTACEKYRNLWSEFFDSEANQLNSAAIRQEFSRLWDAGTSVSDGPVTESQAADSGIWTEAGRLERQPLEDLLARYAERQVEPQKRKKSGRPSTGVIRRRVYDRDPLVFAIAVKRANRKCEADGCQYVPFLDAQGTPYMEVHHIVPLSDGGPDVIDNVACLCPAHHREVHVGQNGPQITEHLAALRAVTGHVAG